MVLRGLLCELLVEETTWPEQEAGLAPSGGAGGRPKLPKSGMREGSPVSSSRPSCLLFPLPDPDSGPHGNCGEGLRAHSGDVQAYGELGEGVVPPWSHGCIWEEGTSIPEESWQRGVQGDIQLNHLPGKGLCQ